ncbi:branched-chain amino acid ABC transporter substrate-binding protein [Rhodoferax koreense]|uniref:Branched-chain amino acid ABC transporter substrate-binding protein n=1 Tax=Rhodoferax koreensis TaxID=1842727 RepID=A0A1P8K172_9BURK|nr:ABC transporter substrate-binding protein [Rhodoferax koreense]APW39747.1 branched-chain amino acid ABC transporter substrate-binding protein [Rhodoferax koreense]
MKSIRKFQIALLCAAGVLSAGPAMAAEPTPGVTKTEIRLGQTMAYSGPVSAYGQYGRAEQAYFKMLNERGGINGRKVTLISLDDSYSPPKTIEQVRRLVERDEVLALFQNLGTASNTAIEKYVNAKQVPNLFAISGDSKWADGKAHPFTTSWQPSNQTEARIYAKHILASRPDAKIAVLYQNDDYGKDALKGFKDELGDKASLIVAEKSYEVSDPTIDSQIVSFKGAGADVFFSITTQKFAAQAIRKAYDIGWKPVQYLNSLASSVGAVLEPAGLDKSVGIISVAYLKDPSDKRWANDAGMKDYLEFMKKYMPGDNVYDTLNVFGYSAAQTLAHVLKQCGDDLSRENLMRQATSIDNLALPMVLPGILVKTTPEKRTALRSMQLASFDGKAWQLFGDVIGTR